MAVELTATDEKVLAKLAQLEERFAELESQMIDPQIAGDPTRIVKIAKEHGRLGSLVGSFRKWKQLAQHRIEAQAMVAEESDAEMRQMAADELTSIDQQSSKILTEVKELLVMSDDAVIGSVIVEIRAGTGGDEAALFARNLYEMYKRYAEKRRWKVENISFSPTELGGFKEVIIGVKGNGVWQELGYEGGGHRVQRVPETEAQGRIHTSAATVAVLPEPEELDIEIKPDEVVEHVARASGPGGQSVNKLNSAIKLEHLPTGITVSMQDEKSQHKNRAKAWRILRSRIFDHFEKQKCAERDATRRDMIGSGDRSQRIRTYNFPQNRVTDHRINLSLYSLDKVIMGEMDELVAGMIEFDKQQRLENL